MFVLPVSAYLQITVSAFQCIAIILEIESTIRSVVVAATHVMHRPIISHASSGQLGIALP